MADKKAPRDKGEKGPAAADTRFDRDSAAIVGDPTGYRFATGRPNVNVTDVGEEMLRGKARGRTGA